MIGFQDPCWQGVGEDCSEDDEDDELWWWVMTVSGRIILGKSQQSDDDDQWPVLYTCTQQWQTTGFPVSFKNIACKIYAPISIFAGNVNVQNAEVVQSCLYYSWLEQILCKCQVRRCYQQLQSVLRGLWVTDTCETMKTWQNLTTQPWIMHSILINNVWCRRSTIWIIGRRCPHLPGLEEYNLQFSTKMIEHQQIPTLEHQCKYWKT